jgi:hypothetical protein
MADAMLTALPQVWKEVKGEEFPGGDSNDVKVIFRAVARGLLTYLEAQQDTTITSITLQPSGGSSVAYTVQALDLNTDLT